MQTTDGTSNASNAEVAAILTQAAPPDYNYIMVSIKIPKAMEPMEDTQPMSVEWFLAENTKLKNYLVG